MLHTWASSGPQTSNIDFLTYAFGNVFHANRRTSCAEQSNIYMHNIHNTSRSGDRIKREWLLVLSAKSIGWSIVILSSVERATIVLIPAHLDGMKKEEKKKKKMHTRDDNLPSDEKIKPPDKPISCKGHLSVEPISRRWERRQHGGGEEEVLPPKRYEIFHAHDVQCCSVNELKEGLVGGTPLKRPTFSSPRLKQAHIEHCLTDWPRRCLG